MAHQYVGYFIRVHLISGDAAEGKVASVDSGSQTITLQNAHFHKDGNTRPLVILQGADIKDLEILSTTAPPPAAAPPPQPVSRKLEEYDPAIISYSPSPQKQHSRFEESFNEINSGVARKLSFVEQEGPQRAYAGSRQPQPQYQHPVVDTQQTSPHPKLKHNKRPPKPSMSGSLPGTGEYAMEHYSPQKPRRGGRDKDHELYDTWNNDVSTDEEFQKDFDYHGNLQYFDKAKIFAQMREEDRINPQNRLVYHNKQPRKLGPKEMVLESTEGHEVANYRPEPTGFCSITNVPIPVVRTQQRKQVYHRAVTECGMSESQLIENAAFNVGQMILQTVGASRRISLKNPSQSPLVVVLVGNTKMGAYGLGVARYLANHNVRVKVCLLEPEEKLIQSVLKQLKMFSFTDNLVIQTRSDVEFLSQDPIDLTVDALLDGEEWNNINADTGFLIKWANSTNVNILSLDIPSGIDGDSVQALPSFIRAKWVVTFVVPLPGHLNPNIRGEIFLADLGIPRSVFSNLGFQYRSPFTDKGVVLLTPNGN